jgi:hypothetical protein
MSDNNGWTDQPGVPMNPAEPGFHWVESCDGTDAVVFWRGHGGDTHYENGDLKELNHWSGHLMWQAKEWRYLGPVLTPAKVEARIAAAHKEWLEELNHDTDALMEAARDSALAEAVRRARHYATIVPMHGSLKSDIYEAAAQAATEIAASIESLAEKGVADLAAQAKRAALAECIAACEAVVRLYRVELPEKHKDRPGGIPYNWKEMWENSAEIAEDIITDIRALSDTPSGMVLVPREPTSAMIHAGGYALQEHAALTMDAARIAWDAMVKAAERG